MAESLGVVASGIAVVGLATQISKSLDDLLTRLEDAELSVLSLRAGLMTFESSMKLLSQWMKNEYQRSSNKRADHDFLQILGGSLAGLRSYLIVLGAELEEIDHKMGEKKMPMWKKIRVVWAEKKIRRYCDEIRFQNDALNLLLNARQLVQQQDAMLTAKHKRLKRIFIKIFRGFVRMNRIKQG